MTRDELLFSICSGYRTPDCYNGDKSCNCEDCNHILNEWLDEYDKQIRAEAINDYYNKLNEKINTDTRLKDTIRDIHDNVANEMYCKGIDDFAEEIKSLIYKWFEKGVINTSSIDKISEELKAGVKNE